MKKLLSVMAMLLMAAVVSFPPAALATATLRLTSGASTVTIVDNGGGDVNLDPGAITYIGPVGANWTVNVSSGFTTPNLGSPSSPSMDLNSYDASKGAGALTLMLSDTDYSLSGPVLAKMAIGGTTDGTVTYTAYFDNGNVLFATPSSGLIGTLGPSYASPPPSFGGALQNTITTDSQYSLTQVVTIAQQAGGSSSLNASLNLVPLPPSALLLGSGLVGLGLLGWRRRQAS